GGYLHQALGKLADFVCAPLVLLVGTRRVVGEGDLAIASAKARSGIFDAIDRQFRTGCDVGADNRVLLTIFYRTQPPRYRHRVVRPHFDGRRVATASVVANGARLTVDLEAGARLRYLPAQDDLGEAVDFRAELGPRICWISVHHQQALAIEAKPVVVAVVDRSRRAVLGNRRRTAADARQTGDRPAHADQTIAASVTVGEPDLRLHAAPAGRRDDRDLVGAHATLDFAFAAAVADRILAGGRP